MCAFRAAYQGVGGGEAVVGELPGSFEVVLRLVGVFTGLHDVDEVVDDRKSVAGLLSDGTGYVVLEGVHDGVAVRLALALGRAAGDGGRAGTLGGGVGTDESFGLLGAVLLEHLGGFEAVLRLEVGEPTFHGVVQEAGDGSSAVGLLADDFAEGL